MKKSMLAIPAVCCLLGVGILSWAAPHVGNTASLNGSLTDPNVLCIGRWDRSDPALYHSYWGGAYLRTSFTGTSVGIRLAVGTTLVVSIDHEAFRSVGAGPGDTLLNKNPLKPGTHTLLVGAAGQNEEIFLQGLILDDGSTTVATTQKPPPLIEFVGDSITTGTGPDGIYTVNWAWQTATALGCDHTQIAFSGLALTSGFGCLPKKVGLDTLYFLEKNYNHLDETPQVPWDFSYTPHVIVVNLGQNDQCGQEPDATMTRSMSSFIGKIRIRFPVAQIAILRPFGGPYAAAIQQAVHMQTADGDTRVHYIDTTGWIEKADTVDTIHPNGVGNLKIMGHLVPLLRPLVTAP